MEQNTYTILHLSHSSTVVALLQRSVLLQHVQRLNLPQHELPSPDELPDGLWVSLSAVLAKDGLGPLAEYFIALRPVPAHVEKLGVCGSWEKG